MSSSSSSSSTCSASGSSDNGSVSSSVVSPIRQKQRAPRRKFHTFCCQQRSLGKRIAAQILAEVANLASKDDNNSNRRRASMPSTMTYNRHHKDYDSKYDDDDDGYVYIEEDGGDDDCDYDDTSSSCSSTSSSASSVRSFGEHREITIFHRDEIVTDYLLGNGTFVDVHEISGFRLKPNAIKNDPIQDYSRQHIKQTAVDRNGRCCYILKHLRSDLLSTTNHSNTNESNKKGNNNNILRGAIDLIIEANFLSRMNHPNIVKVRGWSGGLSTITNGGDGGNRNNAPTDFFLIFDKLHETLEQRITNWKNEQHENYNNMYQHASNKLSSTFKLLSLSSSNHTIVRDFTTATAATNNNHPSTSFNSTSIYIEKLNYAHQIASAIDYLHNHDIIYRDLKPSNIGFKRNNIIQIFDFSLVREMPQRKSKEQYNEDYVFNMTKIGNTSRRYVAPEIYKGKYNLKVDIYSWTMIFYEMLSLKKPYHLYNTNYHFKEFVRKQGVRPIIPIEWPLAIQDLCHVGWANKYKDRPTIKQIKHKINNIINSLSNEQKEREEEEENKDEETYYQQHYPHQRRQSSSASSASSASITHPSNWESGMTEINA